MTPVIGDDLHHPRPLIMSESTGASACSGECSGRREFLRDALRTAALVSGLSALAPFTRLSALDIGPAGTVRYPIPAKDGVSIDTANEVMICRFNGDVFAFSLACPHQNTALRALPGSKGFQCPRHKSRYQPDGTFIKGKATRNMDRLPFTREANDVVVDPTIAYESDKEPAKWASAVVRI